jgi:uncharacterized protein (UPF0297 family)
MEYKYMIICTYIVKTAGVLKMTGNFQETMKIDLEKEERPEASEILLSVYSSLKEKGYNPVSQIVGYILSGDPTYITSHNNARSMIKKLERDELLEELVKSYVKE